MLTRGLCITQYGSVLYIRDVYKRQDHARSSTDMFPLFLQAGLPLADTGLTHTLTLHTEKLKYSLKIYLNYNSLAVFIENQNTNFASILNYSLH